MRFSASIALRAHLAICTFRTVYLYQDSPWRYSEVRVPLAGIVSLSRVNLEVSDGCQLGMSDTRQNQKKP